MSRGSGSRSVWHKQLTRRDALRGAGVALGGALVVSSCQTSSTTAPGGKVVIASTVDANSLDPLHINTTNPESCVLLHVFDALTWRDTNMKVQPHLAESWKLVDDNTWEFKLKKGVTFQNGEPFNAQAVKFSFDRAMNPAEKSTDPVTQNVSLDRTEVVDDYTVRVITKKPAPSMIPRLPEFYIMPPKYYTDNPAATVAAKPVGSGPYKFVEWVKNDHITLEANPNYWKGAPSIQTIVFRPIPEVGTRIAELKSGGVDIIPTVPPDLAKSLDTGTTRAAAIEGGRRMYIGFHITKGSPIEDKRVRQAINYAVDVDAIIKSLQGGYGKRGFTLVVPSLMSPKIKPYTYDVAKAKQLLAAAGYANGFEIVMDTPAGRFVNDKEVAQAAADYLAKVGIKTTVKTVDWSTYTTQMLVPKKSDPLFFLGVQSVFDPMIDMRPIDHDAAVSPTEWLNEEYQKTWREALVTMDEKKRQELVYKAQEIAYDDPPWLFLYYQYDIYGVSKRLNWKPRSDEMVLMQEAKLS